MPPFMFQVLLVAATVAAERLVHWVFDELQSGEVI
jgi:hypothetical protein